ncbi:MAG: putative metal-binding motif-containing protein [Candidatus Heimdallarchaeota archaeon]|nr:putative metal-binding motif-containing protein [Candidatus Heimdallarchaeota archaeon]
MRIIQLVLIFAICLLGTIAVTSQTTEETWYLDSDGDGYGDPEVSTEMELQPLGWVANNLDCNDQDENFNPGARELGDGLDNDCDGLPEEGKIPSKLTITVYGLLFFFMNTVQEILEVVIFTFVIKEFFTIVQLRNGGNT